MGIQKKKKTRFRLVEALMQHNEDFISGEERSSAVITPVETEFKMLVGLDKSERRCIIHGRLKQAGDTTLK